ncbi:hypothetical protein [Deminuibacter soli]|uniref:Uncharacterized protein n=1 Tax=Deminuibacter soli TaxID=2291815 RepID=A0A3E1NI25_9BACT|nr:hypothetical protein [Deminuibacter soli]RFM27562.1 hypothetical protein DXN05_12635 [Deminuibacter soli]
MYHIVSQSGQPQAVLYNNAILELDTYQPLGIILGNSVYGLYAQPCGRIFKGHIRSVSGHLLGKLVKDENIVVSAETVQHCMQFAWQVIAQMQGDGCLWVDDLHNWHHLSLLHILTQQSTAEPVMAVH